MVNCYKIKLKLCMYFYRKYGKNKKMYLKFKFKKLSFIYKKKLYKKLCYCLIFIMHYYLLLQNSLLVIM